MSFGNPLLVSQGDTPDLVIIKINKNYFMNQHAVNGRMLLSKETEL